MARESERLSALVDDLLALARADAGELKLVAAVSAAEGSRRSTRRRLGWRDERQVTLAREVPGAA